MYVIGIFNQSTKVSNQEVQAWIPGLQKQLNNDFSAIWGVGGQLQFHPHPNPAYNIFFLYVRDNSTVQGALGFHDLDLKTGIPYAEIFAVDTAAAGVPLSAVASHEILEMLADPFVDSVTLLDQGQGTGVLYAAEACDPVEGDLYEKDGVQVSNFITPYWFVTGLLPGARYDFLRRLKAPFTVTPGGYLSYQPITPGGGLGGWQTEQGARAEFWNGKKR